MVPRTRSGRVLAADPAEAIAPTTSASQYRTNSRAHLYPALWQFSQSALSPRWPQQ